MLDLVTSDLRLNDALHWPDEHVAWEGVIDANPDMSVPFAVHMFIFHTQEQLAQANGDPDAAAGSFTYRETDAAGVGAILFLHKEALDLSLVAHEVAHMTMFWHGRQDFGRIGARRWLMQHPEQVAEMIGNLTALIWYGIPERHELPC